MKTIYVKNPPFGNEACPIILTCKEGNFPKNLSVGIHVDWTDCSFVSVSQLAAITEVQMAAEIAGYADYATMGPAKQYMARMDYFKRLKWSYSEEFTRHPEMYRFLPLTEIDDSANDTATKLRATVTSHLSFTESAQDMMDYAFGEVIDNVLTHSKTSASGLVCSQYYANMNYVEVCVADSGIGIPQTMSRNPLYQGTSDAELLAKAFELNTGEYIGRTDYGTNEVSGGMGLFITSRVAKALSGHVWAVSYSSAIEISDSGTRTLSGLYYPGTVICMRFPLSNKIVTRDEVFDDGNKDTLRWTETGGFYAEEEDGLSLW
jgi:anti-sigma regulatory factor (Ser/Thr protein kinase)